MKFKALVIGALSTVGFVSCAMGQTVTHSSTLWTKKENTIEGTYRILESDDGRVLELGSDFKTKDGPDLKVVLSPLSIDRVKGSTALDGGAVLGLLTSSSGTQRFDIPDSVDLASVRSVLIHCEEYSILWGGSPLAEGEVVASGDSWTKKENKISGHWEVAQVGDRAVVRLGGDFKTRKGPDLKVVLSPTPIASVNGRSALSGSINLGLLDSPKGASTYVSDGPVDLAAYQSLLIHCEEYSKLWGGAALR